MPIRRPLPHVPERVAAFQFAVGNPTRLLVLRHFLSHTTSTRSEAAAATDVSATAVARALDELEAYGYLAGDLPAAERGGRVVRYTVARDRVLDDAGAFLAWLAR